MVDILTIQIIGAGVLAFLVFLKMGAFSRDLTVGVSFFSLAALLKIAPPMEILVISVVLVLGLRLISVGLGKVKA